jgi:hypothetical protein
MYAIESPLALYTDTRTGHPLEGGNLYFGTVGLNPETNPITVYWDAAGTQPAAQPVRTIGGIPVRAGTPATLYVPSDYSLSVRDVFGRLLYTQGTSATWSIASAVASLAANIAALAGSAGAAAIGFIQAGTGAVARTVQSKLRESVSVMDFGAKGDGVTDDSPAFTAALAWARDNGKLITVPWTPTYYNLATTVSFPGHTANAVNATSINYGVRLLGLGGGGLSSRPKILGNIAGFLFNLSGSDLAHVTYSDTIENLDIANSAPPGTGVGGVKLGYVWDCTIKDCRIYSNGINIDMGAWTMSSRFVNIRHDGNATGYTTSASWSNAAVTTAYGSYVSLSGDYFSGAWAVKVEGGSAFYCKYVFRGYGDISISGMDMEQCCVLFNFVAEGPYKVSGGHIENFDCIFSNDTTVYPSSFSTAGGNGGSGELVFTMNDTCFTGWRGFTSPVVLRPQLASGRALLNFDRTMNKGGPYTAHNLSGAWNAVTDMTNGNTTPVVLSLKATSPLPDFSTTGWKPNYGTARTAKYIVIDADRAETSGQFRLESWTNRLQTEQVLRANFTPNATVNVGIANGQSFSQGITATGARPGDFVRVAFVNNAGTGGLPNGVGWSYSVTANDTVVVNFVNNSGALATVFGTTYAFVDPHDPNTVD